MNKTVQVLKLEKEPIKKTQTEIVLEMNILRIKTGTTRGKHHQKNTRHGSGNLRNWRYGRRNGYNSQRNGKSKKPSDTNHPGSLAPYEETKQE